MDRTYGINERSQNFTEDFNRKIEMEEASWENRSIWKDNI
jgi:hypothetical protein